MAIGDGRRLPHPLTTHSLPKIPSVEAAKKFLPQYDLAERRLHPDNPISVAPQANEDWVMEIRRQNWEAAKRARGVIKDAYKEFNDIFGDRYACALLFRRVHDRRRGSGPDRRWYGGSSSAHGGQALA